jgi:hypothetical protein
MSTQTPNNQTNSIQNSAPQVAETKQNDKELNFRALEQRYQRELASERAAREAAERKVEEVSRRQSVSDDDENDDEPYIDKKKLKKEQAKFGQQIKQETQTEIQQAVHKALSEERTANWLKQNSDFYEVMQHAEKLANKDPELAETILQMPEGFERQKLVYKNIKALGLHHPEQKAPSIQDKIDANRRSPYYQPSGVGTAPYAGASGDYSKQGQKNAYEKMQELKNKLRI